MPQNDEQRVTIANPSPAEGVTPGLGLEAKLKAHTWGLSMRGIIKDFVPGEVTVIADDAIGEGTSLSVEITPFAFDGEVLSCYPRGQRYELHVSITDAGPKGLRRTPRFPVSIPARIFSSCLQGPVDATIMDISGDGLGLQTIVKLINDATLAIESESNIALGLVKHSGQLPSGLFRTGVVLHHIIPVDKGLISHLSLIARASRSARLALRALGVSRQKYIRR